MFSANTVVDSKHGYAAALKVLSLGMLVTVSCILMGAILPLAALAGFLTSGIVMLYLTTSSIPKNAHSPANIRSTKKRTSGKKIVNNYAHIILKKFYQNNKKIKPMLASYQRYHNQNGKIFKNADFIVRHGAMHVSRVALNIVLFANLYRKYGDKDACNLTQEELIMLQIAGFFHDMGRIKFHNDLGGDTPEAEKIGAMKCHQFLKANFPHVSHTKITRFCNAIINKDHDKNDIFCKILQNADCLDVLRADDWIFNKHYLLFHRTYRQNKDAMLDLDKLIVASKKLMVKLGDSPQKFKTTNGKMIDENFSLNTKRKYEKNPHCFTLIEKQFMQYHALKKAYAKGKLIEFNKEPETDLNFNAIKRNKI